jgi:four helix bundle protein
MEKPHKKLNVWRQGMDLVCDVYRVTASLPTEEKYGLTSQMRRSAVSIVSNIAEGAARQSSAEYVQFLCMSLGSASELDTQLEVCERLGFVPSLAVQPLRKSLDEVGRMLIGLRNSIRRRAADRPTKPRPKPTS